MRILLSVPLLLVALTGCGASAPEAAAVKKYMTSEQLALGDPIVNSTGMVLVPIPSGEFKMGITKEQAENKPENRESESPRHLVKISKPYYLGVCEVTQQQYEKVMGARPWEGKPLVQDGPNYAATHVTWDDAVEFCRKLGEQESRIYRLPTEAEWEYACRAGTTTDYSFGDDGAKLAEFAWYEANAYKDDEQYAHAVGQKPPNAWALFDMHGNAWEWCQDWYARYDQKQKETVDPAGPEKGQVRVWRGGSFADAPVNTRSATRLSYGRQNYRPEYLAGFRVVMKFKAGE